MSKDKERDKIFAVIGLGTFGAKVCEVLTQKGGKVIAIDREPDLIEKVKDSVTQSILLDTPVYLQQQYLNVWVLPI